MKVPDGGGFHVVVHSPPGGLWDRMQQAAQRLREPPGSRLDQSELQHGSVILNNDILIVDVLSQHESPL